ncbi:MAG TPA: hypothetical protein VMF07_06045, partial [Solirubrobacteraceae bacterium]|nr:hypothetical protein [Solirubrobacteraceae bacterium]
MPPTISGWTPPIAGAELTATPGVTGDSIDWETCDGNGNPVNGTYLATGTTSYVPSSSDVGTEICAVELSALGGEDGSSDPVGPVQAGPTVSATGLTEGETISVSPAQWGAPFTDVWYDCDSSGNNCQQSSEQPAVGSPYVLTIADGGSTIRVQETATPANGSPAGFAWTAPTGAVVLTTPTNTGRPQVSGTPDVGDTLSVSPGTWTVAPTSYAYQWQRCSSEGCATIQGATAQTYVPVQDDFG